MRNQMKAVIAVEIVVLVAALCFTVFYVANGLYRTSHVLDVLLVVLWVLVAAALLLVFRSRSLVREEMRRRFYLSREWIYNHEIGYTPTPKVDASDGCYSSVMYYAEALARMSYDFEVAEAPTDFEPAYLVKSTTFLFHLVGEAGDPEDRSVVIDQWEGVLQKVDRNPSGRHTYTDVGAFTNAKELARLLEGVLFADEVGQDVSNRGDN